MTKIDYVYTVESSVFHAFTLAFVQPEFLRNTSAALSGVLQKFDNRSIWVLQVCSVSTVLKITSVINCNYHLFTDNHECSCSHISLRTKTIFSRVKLLNPWQPARLVATILVLDALAFQAWFWVDPSRHSFWQPAQVEVMPLCIF